MFYSKNYYSRKEHKYFIPISILLNLIFNINLKRAIYITLFSLNRKRAWNFQALEKVQF